MMSIVSHLQTLVRILASQVAQFELEPHRSGRTKGTAVVYSDTSHILIKQYNTQDKQAEMAARAYD